MIQFALYPQVVPWPTISWLLGQGWSFLLWLIW